MRFLRYTYNSLRGVLVTAIVLLALIPAVLFVGLSLPPVQEKLRTVAESELTELLGVPVEIGRIGISPFSSITLFDVRVTDGEGIETLKIRRLGAGINLMHLLRGDILITYAELYELEGNIYRPTPSSPLNIQPIIDRLSPKDKSKPPTRFDLAINTVVIRKSQLRYDILSEPETDRFNPAHISVFDLKADITLPRVSNSVNIIDIKRLAFSADNALTVTSLSGRVEITPSLVSVTGLDLRLPQSRMAFADFDIALKGDWRDMPLSIKLLDGCRLAPADFSGFLPQLAQISGTASLELDAEGTPNDFTLRNFALTLPDNALTLNLKGQFIGLPGGIKDLTATVERLDIHANAPKALAMASPFVSLPDEPSRIIASLGDIDLTARGSGSASAATIAGGIATSAGAVDIDTRLRLTPALSIDGHIISEGIDLASLSPQLRSLPELGLDADVAFAAGAPSQRSGSFNGVIRNLTWNGYAYSDIHADIDLDGTLLKGAVKIDDPNIALNLKGSATLLPGPAGADIAAEIARFDPSAIGLTKKYPGYELAMKIDGAVKGTNPDNVNGHLTLAGINFSNPADASQPRLLLRKIDLTALTDSASRSIGIASEVINGDITGHFRFATLATAVKGILARINPELFPEETAVAPLPDDYMAVNLTIEPDNPLTRFIKLPVGIISPVGISGRLDSSAGMMSADITVPYLQQKDKLIEGTMLHFTARGPERSLNLQAATVLPTKAGPMTLNIENYGFNGRHDTSIDWAVAGKPNYGDLRFTTSFARDSAVVTGMVDVNPGRIVFNDSIWTVAPSRITVANDRVKVNNFQVSHRDQLLQIKGEASRDTSSVLTLLLHDINLDYVFETLNIPNVAFGGDATGEFRASKLFSKAPVAFTDNLFVRNLSYNGCVMGDGHIRSAWHPEAAGDITIDAVIDEPDGRHSYVNGSIHPTKELLDFRFKADKAPVGFLRPFMAAFCDDISGYATGDAHLYGTFKLLDMTGDLWAEDVAMHIAFTNTTYHTTDSVSIRPGRIALDNVTIYDDRGQTALLSGLLTHKDFKEPRFEFRITDARDFLAYDIKENTEHPWYGKVYGTGSVTITGEPGWVNIGVDMATGEGTDFTFVLDKSEKAADYNFLTFRDKTPPEIKKALNPDTVASEPPAVRAIRERLRQVNQDSPTAYTMTFNIDVTPKAKMTLVMDPVGGDKIRATGSGNLHMSYDSSNEELKMYGTYTLQHGSYNFTLQDIIIKDFTIEDGSSIAFHGDPYSALLNIRAYYALNANLSDLDESFLQDRELNRTNVPVHAVMIVSGDMRSPDISFDLAFPTLTQDTYRKVRSIVSTEEMMNRQIIYLLALNRFYTPEYMNTTSGNELVSVASSTISSQLGNMLGQLSDKVSIAPSIRSDRGDFSDVEVDVALSSHLLDNRLLLNGNFGYRDKSLNDNSFIGDFDIEYLLNRSGSIRLKAYNRYNDQNYYLKSALTTQGVGVVFKRDFDNVFDFLRRMRRKSSEPTVEAADSTATTPTSESD